MVFSRRIVRVLPVVALAFVVTACSTNPVTGKNELTLVSDNQERSIGLKNYGPYRQAQGGDYVVDQALLEYVQSVGDRIAKVSDRKLDYEFRIVNDSTPNAWALPGGKIALNRGLLLEMQSEAELAAVLSHEIVHAAARHSAQAMERGIFIQGAVLAAGVALSDSDYRQAGMLGAGLGASLTKMHFGRDAEREADLYGMQYMMRAGYDPEAAVRLQETFVRLSKGKNPGWLEGMFASHPPSQERVENNRRLVASLKNPGGELGVARYQKKIAYLKRKEKAYKKYDEAKKAFDKKQDDMALKLVNQAIRAEPKEALFHSLRGEIRQREGKKKDAKINYDRAIAHNPEYFRFHLLRGLLNRELGNRLAAESDLQTSIDKLPTAEGYFGLGRIAQHGGRRDLAISHYRKASQSTSTLGKQAGLHLARLDLENNPGRYIKTQIGLDANKHLFVRVSNDSPVAVRRVRLVLGLQSGGGLREQASYWLRRSLAAGERVTVRTEFGPLKSKQARQFSAVITDARLAE